MKITHLFFFMLIALPCLAQQNKMEGFMPQPTLAFGGSFENFNGLNSRVANLPQYKKLPGHTGTIELGWFKERNNLISIAGINLGSSMTGDKHEKSSALRSAGVHIDIGYDVIGNKMVTLYPMLGLGYEMYQARFYRDNSAVDFNDVLTSTAVQNSITPVSFKNGFFEYRVGAGVALHSPKYPSNSIGLQAGYVGSFSSNAWRSSDNQDLANSPEDKLSKVYVALILTFSPWSMMKEMHRK
jgi:hypothetical protein